MLKIQNRFNNTADTKNKLKMLKHTKQILETY